MRLLRILIALLLLFQPHLCVAANIVWEGDEGNDWSTLGNWAGGAVPSSGDIAHFDGVADIGCDIDEAVDVQGIQVDAGYSGNIDVTTATMAIGSSGLSLKGTGDFTAGNATITFGSNSTFHYKDQADNGTIDWDESTISIEAAVSVVGDHATDLKHLTISPAGTLTIHVSSDSGIDVSGICTVNGTLSVSTGKRVTLPAGGTMVLGDGARVTGAGTGQVRFSSTGSGDGVTSFHSGATWDVPQLLINRPHAGFVLAPGNYQSALRVTTSATIPSYALTLTAAGVYQFNSLELENTGTQTLTLANNTNGPASITINGNLLFDDQGGTITVDNSGVATDWVVIGDISATGSGTVNWTKGTGTITANTIAKMGGSFEFNGSSDEVDINAQLHDFSTDFTIAAWIRLPTVTFTRTRQLFSQSTNIEFAVSSAGQLYYTTNADRTQASAGVFAANTWHHVMVTYDDSGTNVLKLYVDGAEEATEDKTATNTVADSRIGSWLGSSEWFAGHIDDVRIFDKALSTAERAALYNSGNGTTDAVASGNCLAWYKLDDFAADTTVADSAASNTGTATQNTNVMSTTPANWDFGGETIENININTSHGTLTFGGGWTSDSYTQTAGSVDFNGQTVETVGDFLISPGATVLNTGFNGSSLTVGGDFRTYGTPNTNLNMAATAGWTLNVTGRSHSRFVTVKNSNSSGSTSYGRRSTDSGSNTAWIFIPYTRTAPSIRPPFIHPKRRNR